MNGGFLTMIQKKTYDLEMVDFFDDFHMNLLEDDPILPDIPQICLLDE